MRWEGNVVGMGRGECIQGVGGKPEVKRVLGRAGSRWDDNINVDLQEMGCWYGLC